jgi:hypothetical protein
MEIDRYKNQGGREIAAKRVRFCVDQLERNGLGKGFKMTTEIGPRLTIEEIVGALVAAEQALGESQREEPLGRPVGDNVCPFKRCAHGSEWHSIRESPASHGPMGEGAERFVVCLLCSLNDWKREGRRGTLTRCEPD